jgi:uncharacterized membrane protein YccF (DUF307 family)
VRTIGNIIWLVVAGLWLAIGYVIAGIIACIFIITIPFGIASFRIAGYALWPFGRTVVPIETRGAASTIGNVIWFVVAGWWLALEHLVTALFLAITIIGIPFAVANLKLMTLAFAPLGKRIVPIDAVVVLPPGAVAPPQPLG